MVSRGRMLMEGLIGESPAMRRAFELLRRAAATDAPVLLVGEPGTGKERAAEAIHAMSDRAAGPFVLAAISDLAAGAAEAELFGATQNGGPPGGLLAEARGGTLYLAGIHAVHGRVQARLAAHLARIGDGDGGAWPAPARVVASSEVALDEVVRAGRFRDDLFYRIGVITIALPPLRERGRDVAVMAERMLEAAAGGEGCRVAAFTRPAVRALLAHPWPGNVDELATRVHRAVIMARGRRVTPRDLGLADAGSGEGPKLGEARAVVERDIVVVALRKAAGNVSVAARAIGVSRPTMYDLMRKHSIAAAEFRVR